MNVFKQQHKYPIVNKKTSKDILKEGLQSQSKEKKSFFSKYKLADVASIDLFPYICISAIISYLFCCGQLYFLQTGRYDVGSFSYFISLTIITPYVFQTLFCSLANLVNNIFKNKSWFQKHIGKSAFTKSHLISITIETFLFFPLVFFTGDIFNILGYLAPFYICGLAYFKTNGNLMVAIIIHSIGKMVEFFLLAGRISLNIGFTVASIIVLLSIMLCIKSIKVSNSNKNK